MRWVFIGVVALNLLYFGWHFVNPAEVGGNGSAALASPSTYPATLQLLSERSGAPTEGAPAPATIPALPSGCPALGPAGSAADADRLRQALVDGGLKVESRQVELKGVPVYWVYIPPYPTKALAMRQLRELHARGVDSFTVTEGQDANAISLGTFSNRDSARGVQSRMRTAGYPAEIREQLRDMAQTWVVVLDPAAQGFLERVPRDLASAVKVQRLPCAR